MKRALPLLLSLSSLALAAACDSSSTTDDGGPPDSTSDVQQQQDSAAGDSGKDGSSNDGSGNDSSGSDASDAGSDAGATVTLTVNDYIGWCKVIVNGGTPNTGSIQTYTFAPNTTVTAVGDTANSSAFYWGYWGNVAPDGGLSDGGEDLGKTVTFTITNNLTLNACCPDNGQALTQCTF